MRSHEDTFKNKAQDLAGAAKHAGDKTKEAAETVFDKVKETASGVMANAKDLASSAVDRTKETASAIGQEAEDATHAVGRGVGSMAGAVRDYGPQGGMLGTAASNVASGMENAGQYLEKGNLQGMGEDLMTLIKRNPLPALFVGIGLGFIIARVTTSHHS